MNLFGKLLTLILNLKERESEKKKRVISPSTCLEKRKFLHAHLNCRR